MLNKEDFTYFDTYLIGQEAEKRGIEVNKIFTKGAVSEDDAIQLNFKGHKEVLLYQLSAKTNVIAYKILKNKELTKYFLRQRGIRVAKGKPFLYSQKNQVLAYCKEIKYPVVIKPLFGKHGAKVFIGLDSDEKVLAALLKFGRDYKTVLVEKEFEGREYRIFVTRNKFIAATYRMPANVQGDGVNTIKNLIKMKNKDPRRGIGHQKSLVKIKINNQLIEYLQRKKKKLSTVPEKDAIVYLQETSNLSTGGDSYDVTDLAHPKVKKLAIEVINAIPGLAYAGMDYMTKDISAEPTDRNYIIVELNGSPMISMHHIPYSGKERNVAGVIIDQLFPETVKKVKTSETS